jgi:hypothetical protein
LGFGFKNYGTINDAATIDGLSETGVATMGFVEGYGSGVVIHIESASAVQLWAKNEGSGKFKFVYRYRTGQNWDNWIYLQNES